MTVLGTRSEKQVFEPSKTTTGAKLESRRELVLCCDYTAQTGEGQGAIGVMRESQQQDKYDPRPISDAIPLSLKSQPIISDEEDQKIKAERRAQRRQGQEKLPITRTLPLPSNSYLEGRKKNHSTQWVVKDLLKQNGLHALYGAPSSGKTLVALSLAMHIAYEGDKQELNQWCGLTVKHGPCVFIAGEDPDGCYNRIDALVKEFGISPDDLADLYIVESGTALDTEMGFNNLTRTINSYQITPVAIFIDTLIDNYAGDENSVKEVKSFNDNCKRLAEYYNGCGVIYLTHTPKGNGDELRGASNLKASLDFGIRVRQTKGTVYVTCKKARNGSRLLGKDLAFSIKPVTLDALDNTGEFETSAVLVLKDVKFKEKQVKASTSKLIAPRLLKSNNHHLALEIIKEMEHHKDGSREYIMLSDFVTAFKDRKGGAPSDRTKAYRVINDMSKSGVLMKDGERVYVNLYHLYH